ncbi:hypothetical protein A8C32_15385 [Flavivirga aquatica]|uniref:NigD-like C-terminal beta sandwich domain-containing protein n=1 Tax=Flavivirga aquatica TaxID=1849968 RepID=A0A1E5T907_9FLAO|nr:hypothetical protein [Flavivirga aquatica]OEK07862.1 hypothetical protein A8C32_15385 [Flavivirga aquatica]
MNKVKYIIISFLTLVSCSDSSDDVALSSITLESYIKGRTIETGAVIACAASDKDSGEILTFYYPKFGALNVRYYETDKVELDNNDFSNYTRRLLNSTPFFNGYLGKFIQESVNEKWIIITYELDNEIKMSNPIRTKQISKPTVWNEDVIIDQSQSRMPNFSWQDNAFGDNAIYFQVVSDAQNNLLSGTYTLDNHFQYYDTSNLVLNITTKTPPNLILNNTYNFTLMDVSIDNWVNGVILKTFKIE